MHYDALLRLYISQEIEQLLKRQAFAQVSHRCRSCLSFNLPFWYRMDLLFLFLALDMCLMCCVCSYVLYAQVKLSRLLSKNGIAFSGPCISAIMSLLVIKGTMKADSTLVGGVRRQLHDVCPLHIDPS